MSKAKRKPRQYRTMATLSKAFSEGRIDHDEYLAQAQRLRSKV